jgi:formate dehydrogenase major subunit
MMTVKASDAAPVEGAGEAEPVWEEPGPERYSTDPRDFGWVRENVPCQTACPAETNIPAYIRLIVEGRYDRAYEVNALANILPGVLGRICSRPCEDACRHAWPGNGEPVDICHLKRAASDMRDRRVAGPDESPAKKTGKRVAVVGAGPAGIAAAHDLAIFGHAVTLYEREELPGGMLYYGIPEFRMPRDILAEEIDMAVGRFGVDIRCSQGIGNEPGEIPLSDLLEQYDAVLLCTGTMQGVKLPLREREDDTDVAGNIPGVESGLDFLMELHRGETKTVGQHVAVIGGGFTAMDCTRVARRMGAVDVNNHIRTTEEYIPVWPEEVAEAKREAIGIRGLRTPVNIETGADDHVSGLKLVRNRLGGFRAGGRRNAVPIDGTEFVEPCDTILVCIGQEPVHDFLGMEVELDRWNNMQIDEIGMTSVDKLFAAGDYVSGAATVIEAIGHGREIAINLDAWLIGRTRRRRAVKITNVSGMFRERDDDFIPRQHMPMEPMESRFRDLETEAEHGFEAEGACVEGKRCYLCSLNFEIDVDNCIYCRACIEVAPKNCIKLIEGVEVNEDGSYGHLKEAASWDQARAIWIDNNECIRCGACEKVCPTKCISITRKELVWQNLE